MLTRHHQLLCYLQVHAKTTGKYVFTDESIIGWNFLTLYFLEYFDIENHEPSLVESSTPDFLLLLHFLPHFVNSPRFVTLVTYLKCLVPSLSVSCQYASIFLTIFPPSLYISPFCRTCWHPDCKSDFLTCTTFSCTLSILQKKYSFTCFHCT